MRDKRITNRGRAGFYILKAVIAHGASPAYIVRPQRGWQRD
jgi:hypothetical protein